MIKEMTFNYIVDKKNRVVICQGIVPFTCEDCGEEIPLVFDKAVARCREGDEFDVEFGKKLAQRKLFLKINKRQRQDIEEDIAEIRQELTIRLKEYDALNNELSRHVRKYNEILASKYPHGEEEQE